jgi:hypothetical protein
LCTAAYMMSLSRQREGQAHASHACNAKLGARSGSQAAPRKSAESPGRLSSESAINRATLKFLTWMASVPHF